MSFSLPNGLAGGGKKEGLYVWKKSNVLTFELIETSATVKTLKNVVGFDKHSVDTSFFTGFSGATGILGGMEQNIKIVTDGKMDFIRGTSMASYFFSYNNASGTMTFTTGATVKWDNGFSKNAFAGYVVSDDQNAYPNGGMKDGYWYEKVKEGSASMSSGRIVCASNGRITVSHGLGKKPTGFCIMDAATVNNRVSSNTGLIFYPNLYYDAATIGRYFYSASQSTYDYKKAANNESITFPQTFVYGREYVWFAFV